MHIDPAVGAVHTRHFFHESVGRVLLELKEIPGCQVLLASECLPPEQREGKVKLFSCDTKCRENEYCNVDALVLDHDYARTIIEIEEGKAPSPVLLVGKIGTASIARCFIHETKAPRGVPLSDRLQFVQIVNRGVLKKEFKPDQLLNLERSIQHIIPIKGSCISEYRMIVARIEDFSPGGSGQPHETQIRDLRSAAATPSTFLASPFRSEP